MSFYCEKHDRLFSNKSNFNKHLRDQHNDNNLPTRRSSTLFCFLCDISFSKNTDRINHLELVHNKKIEVINLQFENLEDFKNWKIKEEETNCVFFRLNSNSSNVKSYYFRNRNPTNQNSKKTVYERQFGMTHINPQIDQNLLNFALNQLLVTPKLIRLKQYYFKFCLF